MAVVVVVVVAAVVVVCMVIRHDMNDHSLFVRAIRSDFPCKADKQASVSLRAQKTSKVIIC